MLWFETKVGGIENGFLNNKFGGNASSEFKVGGIPVHSPRIEWDKVSGAKSYALEIIDYDAQPVCGFPFVHWIVANIKDNFIEEGFHKNEDGKFVIGVNSTTQGNLRSNLDSNAKKESNIKSSIYVGPMPPNCDHHYIINVYALDIDNVNLKVPYFLSDLHDCMRGHILGRSSVEFKYKKDVVSYS